MYAGHFAAGLALKARFPRVPSWIPLLGVGVLDVLFGPFVILGIERVTMTPNLSPGFRLDCIDWSHSLVMGIVWALAFGALFVRKDKTIAVVAAVSVFSHFVLDLVMHPPDLALWPGSAQHLGFGLWQRLPVGWWFVELGVIAAGGAYYLSRARRSVDFGGRAGWAVAAVVAFHVLNAPWVSPLTHARSATAARVASVS